MMKIKDLKEMLGRFDDNKEVVFRPYMSDYVYEPQFASTHDVRKFWGNDTHAVIIGGEQVGAI